MLEHESPSDLKQQPDAEHDRAAQPVDREEAPRLPFPVVGIGASAGGLQAFIEFFSAMPEDSGMAFVLVQHLPPERESLLADILSRNTKMPVIQVEDGLKVAPNHVYVIRPGHTLTIEQGVLRLGERLQRPMNNRPVDDFFRSLAVEQRERGIAIILSGMGSNGTAGAQAIKAVGGLCVAQEPETAKFPSMPRHLIDAGYADYILPPQNMPEMLISYAAQPYARGERSAPAQLAARELQHLREILAVLRTRTQQDFNGYKKPTVLRRIQRRMGLHRIKELNEYAKFLRQNPGEVVGLSDDLLIHVTGFFRDADAWEALHKQVIVPLVASREAEATVRCWVAACSSGEEAYTLAMLLSEESERLDKRLDIKVFATDMADRTLQNARQGLYPGGIESEIVPERLDRFFTREDSLYRIRPELRERVIFAPQNVLHDPPFSRLDIITCRNLLIYLEPEVQQRVLSLLHFGLREGGTLFLGTSETVGDSGDLFEPIDKKSRLFRRIGPTRHGAMELPIRSGSLGGEVNRGELRAGVRPSVSQLTARALLSRHTPAAVTVDREGRIVYFHGETETFLNQPRGEATRDLFLLIREGARSAARSAFESALHQNSSVTVTQGWLEVEGERRRLAVTASPLDQPLQDYYVLSFQDLGAEFNKLATESAADPLASSTGVELQRVREELQSTIEELQTSNEELKASHEEVVSVNEELQSSNEELETGREEMQSLNEELSTVNAQLQAKMEEHEAARNDLASLLTSTDIAVLFLDPNFRIRRFTPPAKELIELISTDIGRPLSDLARKFEDPELVAHAEAVLDNLIPMEREISSVDGRWFQRRVLPYRTTDNRIDGVVITFVDISGRKQIEESLRQSQEQLQAEFADMALLYRLTSILVGSRDLQGSLEEILTATIEMHATSLGTIRLYDPITGEMRLVASRGLPSEYASRFRTLKFNSSVPHERALLRGERVVFENITEASDPQLVQMAQVGGFRAMQATPLMNRNGELLGVLSTQFAEPHRPTERDLRMTDLFARQAADVIENKQQQELLQNSEQRYRALSESLEQKVQARSRLLKFLHDIVRSANESATVEAALRSALQLSCAYLRCSIGHVWLLGEEGQELVSSRIWYESTPGYMADGGRQDLQRLPLDSEPLGTVFRTAKPLWIELSESASYPMPGRLPGLAMKSVVVLPIANRGKVFAALELFAAETIAVEPEFRDIVPSLSTQVGHVFERKQLEREVAQIADQEQQRMGEELHDGLSQQLAAIALLAGGLSDKLKGGGSPLVEKAENLLRAAEEAKKQCRALTKGLIPVEVSPDGLMHALRDLAERTEATFGIECEFRCSQTVLVANSFVATHLYKISAEAVHNAAKHAHAKTITITLQVAGGVQVVVEDNGRGLPADSSLALGDGLRIAHHRAGLIGAQITLERAPRGGTVFNCTVSN